MPISLRAQPQAAAPGGRRRGCAGPNSPGSAEPAAGRQACRLAPVGHLFRFFRQCRKNRGTRSPDDGILFRCRLTACDSPRQAQTSPHRAKSGRTSVMPYRGRGRSDHERPRPLIALPTRGRVASTCRGNATHSFKPATITVRRAARTNRAQRPAVAYATFHPEIDRPRDSHVGRDRKPTRPRLSEDQ